jgi:hypothetical protein
MRGVFVLKVRDIWVGGYKFELDTAFGARSFLPNEKEHDNPFL